jgi:gliding motility-associated-like protein
MKRIMLSILFWVAILPVFSQRGNNWQFGFKAGIDFSTGIPVPTNYSQMSQLEGSSSICDLNGQLMFYSDGTKVWNRQNNVMPNGTGLAGNYSSTQSSMIVPFPADPRRYYIFTVDFIGGPSGLCYSVVNMDLDGGLGDIELKNSQLVTPTIEKITAVNHCNGKDVWVITHRGSSDEYYAYLVTSTGILPPVISHSGRTAPFGSIGYLKASPDGSRLAAAQWGIGLDLFDFNPVTGAITNRRAVINANGNSALPYGLEFSPNSKLLYVSSSKHNPVTGIYRYDISQYNYLDAPVATIAGSRIELDTDSMTFITNSFSAIQLGPDGKAYMTIFSYPFLAVINNPNLPGTACNYIRNGLNLLPGTICSYGLPDFNQSYFISNFSFNTSCSNKSVDFFYSKSADVQSLKWDFGDPVSGAGNTSTLDSPQHIFSVPGVYTVKLVTYLPCRNDTFIKKVTIDPFTVDLGPDKAICADSLFLLDPHAGAGKQYKWQDNSTLPTLSNTLPGLYWVEVSRTDGSCKTRDSILISSKPNPIVNLGPDSLRCENKTLVLDATNPGASYTWQDNSTAPLFMVNKSGQYYVQVNLNGCQTSDTILVGIKYLPRVFMVTEAGICPGMDIQLTPVYRYTENARYLWSNGSNEPFTMALTTGNYRVDVSNECGTTSASIRLYNGACQLYVPTAFTPNGDGKNDIFKAAYGENVIKFHLEVFNRWGQRVFSSHELSKGWDGRINGILQPTGVFAWKITYTLYNEPSVKILKGTTTLIN